MSTGYEHMTISDLNKLRADFLDAIEALDKELYSRQLRNPLNLNIPGSSVAVKFTKFYGKDKPYLFTAVGVADHSGRSRWTVSGSAEGLTWPEFKDFMGHRETEDSTYRVIESFMVI